MMGVGLGVIEGFFRRIGFKAGVGLGVVRFVLRLD